MPIPPLTTAGWLPPGEYACTLEELYDSFVSGVASQTREPIYNALVNYMCCNEVRRYGVHALIDGGFVSRKPDPKDVDIVLGMRPGTVRRLLSSAANVGVVKTLSGSFAGILNGHHLIHAFPDDVSGPVYRKISEYFQRSDRPGEPSAKGILQVRVL